MKNPMALIFAFAFFALMWSWQQRLEAEAQVRAYQQQVEGMKDALGYTH